MDLEKLSPLLVAEADELSVELIEWILTKLHGGTRPVALHWALHFATSIASGQVKTSVEVFKAANRARERDGLEKLAWQFKYNKEFALK